MKISLNLHAFLGASLALTLSSGATIHTRRDNSACEPRAHVVIDSFTVEIYNATIHGTDGHLRLFKMIPLACPDRHTGMLPRESSSRTDLQLRDTRTELSTIVYRRGFFTWVNSLLKWVPYAKTAVGLFNLGECIWDWVERGKSVVGGAACVLGGITTVYGIGELLQKNGVISLPTGSTHIKELIEYVDKTFANLSDFVLSRRADNPEFSAAVAKYHTLIQNWTLPGIRHYATGDGVTLWDVARANATHPITILHSNRAFKANHSHAVNVWSSVPIPGSGVPRFHLTVPFPYASNTTSTFPSAASSELRRRQGSSGSSGDGGGSSASACGSNVNDLGQLSECITQTGPAPPNAPQSMYYGFDLYGTKDQVEEFQDDLGSTFNAQNGFVPSVEAMAEDITAADAWDTCVCQMTQNTWISTGSIQMSWDSTYNGFSPCWSPNCDNAAII